MRTVDKHFEFSVPLREKKVEISEEAPEGKSYKRFKLPFLD